MTDRFWVKAKLTSIRRCEKGQKTAAVAHLLLSFATKSFCAQCAVSWLSLTVFFSVMGLCQPVSVFDKPQPLFLVPNHPVQVSLSQHNKQAYHLALKTGQYFKLTVNTSGVASRLLLLNPQGKQIRERDCYEATACVLSEVGRLAGTYSLMIEPLKAEAGSGIGQLILAQLRPTSPRDSSQITAEIAESAGEKLLAAWDAKATQLAIRQFQIAFNYGQQKQDAEIMTRALCGLGAAYYSLGELETASRFYQRALALQEKDNTHLLVETLNQLCPIYLQHYASSEALKCARRALALSQAQGNRLGEAKALNNLGAYHDWNDEKQQALSFLNQAKVMAEPLNMRGLSASIFLNLGSVYSDLGNAETAFAYFEQALTGWQFTGHKLGEALTLTEWGRLYARVGEKQKALNHYAQAIEFFTGMGNQLWLNSNLTHAAYVYLALGEYQRALRNYETVLKAWRVKKFIAGESLVLAQVGEAHYYLRNFRKALDYFQQALPNLRKAETLRSAAYTTDNVGLAHAALGEFQLALASYQAALPLFENSGNKQGQAYLLNHIGDAHRAMSKQVEALHAYQQALLLNQSVGDRFGESLTRYHIALAELDRGKLTEARTQVETALALSESLRAKVISQDVRTSFTATIHQYYELQIEVLMALHRQQRDKGFDALAFAAAEKARARSLVEALTEAQAGGDQTVEPKLSQQERGLRQQLNGKAERLMRLEVSKATESERAAIEADIENLTGQHQDVVAQMRAGRMRYPELIPSPSFELSAIQHTILNPDTVLLEYALGEQRSYVWVVSNQGLASFELPPRAEIEQAASQVKNLVTARQSLLGEKVKQSLTRMAESEAKFAEAAKELSQLILTPIARHIADKRLVVVSEGVLQSVPFAALPDPSGEAVGAELKPLIVKHEIVCLPSASTLAVIRKELSQRRLSARAVAVLADPVFSKDDERFFEATRAAKNANSGKTTATDRNGNAFSGASALSRLPATRVEAATILSLVPQGMGLLVEGFGVNRAFVTGAELSQYRIVHFATHGVVNSQYPALSAVALSNFDKQGRPQDGFLRLHDIYNLKLPAELVVLSACDTGLGKDVKGEGLIALSRGFMHAGAPRVLASMWKVNDGATAEFMKEFYQRLMKENLSPAAALRGAQVAMWEGGSKPFHWAAFVLQGEYRGSQLGSL